MIEKKPATDTKTVVTPANQTAVSKDTGRNTSLFAKENYTWMLAGLIVIALGMFLMSGGKSTDPTVFEQKEVYSTTRITIAPILILIGLGLEVFAIFKRPAGA